MHYDNGFCFTFIPVSSLLVCVERETRFHSHSIHYNYFTWHMILIDKGKEHSGESFLDDVFTILN